MDVVSLNSARAERDDDNRHMTPADTLREALADIESGERPATSLMALTLDTDEKQFSSGWYAANLKSSEMIALMETVKAALLRDMGYS